MTTDRHHDELVDLTFDLLREQPTPALDGDELQRVVRVAMVDGARRRGERARRARLRLVIAAAAAVLLVAGATLVFGVTWRPESAGPSRTVLPTGDRITAMEGTAMHMLSVETAHRRVELGEGAALFEVADLGRDDRFEVVTGDVEVLVTGTVFSVDVGAATTIRVYEGSVEVRVGAERFRLEAAQQWDSLHRAASRSSDGPLARLGREAARRRALISSTELIEDESPATVERPSSPDVSVTPPASQEPEVGGSDEGLLSMTPEAESVEHAEAMPLPSLDEARSWIGRGRAQQSLTASRRALRGGEPLGPWRMVEADALRSLGRHREAVTSYELAAGHLPPPRRAQAGFLAASLRLRRLDDPTGSLRILESSGASSSSSPLAERSLALRARALVRLGRHSEARAVARSYLDRWPEGAMAQWMRRVLDE